MDGLMAASVNWRWKYLDLDGNTIGTIQELEDETADFTVNGFDQLGFSLSTKNPLVNSLQPLSTVVKMWRDVNDADYGVSFTAPDGLPTMGGFISGRIKKGHRIFYTVSSPLWKVQFHWHLLVHRLKDPLKIGLSLSTEIPATLSGLIWKHIDLVENTFGPTISQVGLRLIGDITGNDSAIFPGVYNIAPGTWTWDQGIEFLIGQLNAPDLSILYQHVEGEGDIAIFVCQWPGKGLDKTGSIHLTWNPGGGGSAYRLRQPLDFEELYEPKVFGNWGRVFGHGRKGSPFTATKAQESGDLGIDEVGIYMLQDSQDAIVASTKLQASADQLVARGNARPRNITATLSPAVPPYFTSHYLHGDLITVSEQDEQWSFGPEALRIFRVSLAKDRSNKETATLTLAPDVLGKVT